jgi:hypothetical protein
MRFTELSKWYFRRISCGKNEGKLLSNWWPPSWIRLGYKANSKKWAQNNILRAHWAIIYLEEVLGMKQCRQKHGGFSRLLTPEWRHWSQILVVITTDQPRSSAFDDNFTPLVFAQKSWNSAESLYKKHQEKMQSFCMASWCHNYLISRRNTSFYR